MTFVKPVAPRIVSSDSDTEMIHQDASPPDEGYESAQPTSDVEDEYDNLQRRVGIRLGKLATTKSMKLAIFAVLLTMMRSGRMRWRRSRLRCMSVPTVRARRRTSNQGAG